MNNRELFKKISDLDEITIHVPTNINLKEVNYLPKAEVLELIEQLDEPKKPVIPQFVAEWIEKQQAKGYSLRDAMAVQRVPENVRAWLIKPYENQEIFARAWLGGYEIEKEKLYIIPLKGLITTDGHQQYLTGKVGRYFASRRNYSLKQTFTQTEVDNNVPDCYREWAKLVEE